MVVTTKPLHERVARRPFRKAWVVERFRCCSQEFGVAREGAVSPVARCEDCVGPPSAAEQHSDGNDLRVSHQSRLAAFLIREPGGTAVPAAGEHIVRDGRGWPATDQLGGFIERGAGCDAPSAVDQSQVAVVGAENFRQSGDAGLWLSCWGVQPALVSWADPLVWLEAYEHGAGTAQVCRAWPAGFDGRVARGERTPLSSWRDDGFQSVIHQAREGMGEDVQGTIAVDG